MRAHPPAMRRSSCCSNSSSCVTETAFGVWALLTARDVVANWRLRRPETSIRHLAHRMSVGSLPPSRRPWRPVGVGTEPTALKRLDPHDLACAALKRELKQSSAWTACPNGGNTSVNVAVVEVAPAVAVEPSLHSLARRTAAGIGWHRLSVGIPTPGVPRVVVGSELLIPIDALTRDGWSGIGPRRWYSISWWAWVFVHVGIAWVVVGRTVSIGRRTLVEIGGLRRRERCGYQPRRPHPAPHRTDLLSALQPRPCGRLAAAR